MLLLVATKEFAAKNVLGEVIRLINQTRTAEATRGQAASNSRTSRATVTKGGIRVLVLVMSAKLSHSPR